MSARLLSCTKAAISWSTATDLVRTRELAGARMVLSGETSQVAHEARRAVDPTLPAFASLNATEAAQLETITTAVVSQGQG